MDLDRTRKVLDELSSRAILVDVEREGKTTYTLPPPIKQAPVSRQIKSRYLESLVIHVSVESSSCSQAIRSFPIEIILQGE